MAKQETLDRIEEEIAQGKLGIARDRLHGLITTYPEDLLLRSRLGDVYWALGYPELAGQWWFLDEELTDEKLRAISEFARVHRNNVNMMMRALRLGELDYEVAERAASRLAEFGSDADFSPGDLRARAKRPNDQSYKWMGIGCTAVLMVILALACVGLIALLVVIF